MNTGQNLETESVAGFSFIVEILCTWAIPTPHDDYLGLSVYWFTGNDSANEETPTST